MAHPETWDDKVSYNLTISHMSTQPHTHTPICTHAHTPIRTHTHSHVHTYKHSHMHASHTPICTHADTPICTHTFHMHTYTHSHTHSLHTHAHTPIHVVSSPTPKHNINVMVGSMLSPHMQKEHFNQLYSQCMVCTISFPPSSPPTWSRGLALHMNER